MSISNSSKIIQNSGDYFLIINLPILFSFIRSKIIKWKLSKMTF